MTKILLIEDDTNLGRSLKERLEAEAYSVLWAENLTDAETMLKESPSLIILDWMLPDGQGNDFLVRFRQNGQQTPVIFLTAKVDLVDKILGLEMGANDYMTKPFEVRELLARIRVQLRANSHPVKEEKAQIKVGALAIDLFKFKVRFNQKEVDLVKKEFELLQLLAESPEKVFSREEILNRVWGYDVYPTTRTVDTHILMLRQKISGELIETVRSVGYRLRVIN